MEQYMKATATPFVHHALKDTILKIMESKQSCEVNPTFTQDLRGKSTHFRNSTVMNAQSVGPDLSS